MNKLIITTLLMICATSVLNAQDPTPKYNPITVDVSRKLSKDLLGNNSNGFFDTIGYNK